jgi:hypothetical protein
MPAASVFDLIQRNVVLAQQQRLHYWFPAKQRIRYEGSDRTRLVIDDLATLASVSPEIESDTSFLPFVTFYLGREGITSLIVHTDNVRPDSKPSAGLTRRLEEVAKRTIMVWSVPFEGQDRIALTVPPAGGSDESGLIRELAWTQLEPLSRLREAVSRSRPIVTPRFELYSGVARREPKRIPLAVYLYEETEAFGEYLEREELLFRQMFVPSARNGTVLVAIEADRVAAIREFCMLPLDAQEDHSIVFQVDLHWIMKTDLTERQEHRPHGALTNQTHYGFEAFHKDREIRLCQDPFGLFQNYQGPEKVEDDRRIDYFENKFYVARAKSATIADETFRMIGIDRVPYMWDFGFLLLRRATWEQAKKCIVRPKKTVGQVWEQLGNRKVVSWRDFLGACSEVVKYSRLLDDQRRIAFDVAGRSADSMGCFVLEIWMSEMKAMAASTRGPKGLARLSDALNVLSTPKYAPEEFHKRLSLTQVLSPIKRSHEEEFRNARGKGGNVSFGAFALYKVWRLLLEVLDFDSILSADGFNIRLSPNGSSSSVATRHWYKTACEFSAQLTKEGGDEATPWPLRLPGNYSVRGDWFLASPATSRSALLARHAIDLLCSRRSNITRMQFGLGLPVRDVLDDTGSALRRPSGFTGERDLAELTYEELCWLGAPKESHGGAGSFRWLWRTSIKDYDRINQAFLKWIARVIQWTVDYRRAQRSNWIGGFATYDRLSQGNPRAPGFESFIEFGQLCDLFLSDLKAASREDGPAEAGFRWTVRRSDGE